MCHSAVFGPPNCSSFRCAVFSGAHDLCRVESRSCYILSISLISICNEWLIYSSVPTDPMKDWKYLKKKIDASDYIMFTKIRWFCLLSYEDMPSIWRENIPLILIIFQILLGTLDYYKRSKLCTIYNLFIHNWSMHKTYLYLVCYIFVPISTNVWFF